jgi:hypothetical protein
MQFMDCDVCEFVAEHFVQAFGVVLKALVERDSLLRRSTPPE